MKSRIGIYAGQYYDQETGLHYNYHRYYDPKLGRYLRADPIGLDGGINPYVYAEGNPIIAFDPFGLKECSYQGSWGKPSFKVNSLDIDVKLGSGLPNKWLKFHIGTAIFNINGTISLEINCVKACKECDRHQIYEWTLNSSYTDTVSPEFKIRKGPLSLMWKLALTEVDYNDVRNEYYDPAIKILKNELTQKAMNAIGDATTYCKLSRP